MSRDPRKDAREKRRRRERNERWLFAEGVRRLRRTYAAHDENQQPMRVRYMTLDPLTGKTSIVWTP